MPYISSACDISFYIPEAKVAMVTELVYQEDVLLAKKMLLVLTMKLPFSHSIERTSSHGCDFSYSHMLWVWIR